MSSSAFLNYVDDWLSSLPSLPLRQLTDPPESVALVSTDMINGFCHEGPLASPRVHALIPPIINLFQRAYNAGLRHFLLTQDTHEPGALEFAAYPPHCIRGTPEAETIPEIKALPFFDRMLIFEKNTIDASLRTGLPAWIDAHPEIDRVLVVGDCTDICVYQLAMHFRLDANARARPRRVIVPADCVDTYDLPVDTAISLGSVPHDAGLLHRLFLYHMRLNGIEVYAKIT
jgi:nicotinamidase-related amidase